MTNQTKKHVVLSNITTKLLYEIKAELIKKSKRRVTDEDVIKTCLMAYLEAKQ